MLARFPTSEAEDRALLNSKSLTDWREQMLVQFRVLRKEALRLTITALEEELGQPARALSVRSSAKNMSSTHINVLTDTTSEL